MKNAEKYLPWILLLVVLTISVFREYRRNSVVESLITFNDSARIYNNKGLKEYFNKMIETENRKQLEMLAAGNDTLRKMIAQFQRVQSATVVHTETKIIQEKIPVNIPCEFDPVQFKKSDSTYSISGTIDSKTLTIDSLVIPNDQAIVVGEKRKNIFSRKEFEVHIVNSNPLIRTEKIQGMTIREDKKWFQTTVSKIAAGFLIGYAVSKKY